MSFGKVLSFEVLFKEAIEDHLVICSRSGAIPMIWFLFPGKPISLHSIMKIMVSLCLFSFVMFISMSMASVKSDARPHQQYLKRMSRHSGQQQQRYFRHIMGKLIDTETNTIYNIDGQKQFGTPVNADAVDDSSVVTGGTGKYYEDLACLEACYKCVEDFPVTAVSSHQTCPVRYSNTFI